MKELQRLVVVVPAVVLVGLLAWLYWTRGTMEQLADLRKGATAQLVDQRPYATAQTLSGLAVSAEEQGFAQEAERLADHDVDQAFALALRQASLRPRSASGEAGRLQARVNELKAIVKDDQARVDALAEAAQAGHVAAAEGDDQDVAKAQLGLDTDELADAQADLARVSGDNRGEIQQELTAREAALKKGGGERKDTALVVAKRYGTLWGRGSAWLEQRSRAKLLEQAQTDAASLARSLSKQHDELQSRLLLDEKAGTAAAGTARVAGLQRMATERVMMSILDDRAATEQQLEKVYAQWERQVWLQHRIVAYLVLQSMAWIALIVLVAALAGMAGRIVLRRLRLDARRERTLERIATVGAQALGLLGVLLVVFGVPQQMPTILGLTTAGLTVVFQDYILAFCGWFVLMGRSGVRVSDWIEIDSIAGEVAEIGLFRTTLLETGNWTSRGHPTGRRVRFSNSFAIKGQFFNFTTSGQWMWDEIKLNVPPAADASAVVERMRTVVVERTARDTEDAEREWQATTRHNGLSQFRAEPTINLRPAATGVDVIVRFVTRASDRFEVRNGLYEALMHEVSAAPPAAQPAASVGANPG